SEVFRTMTVRPMFGRSSAVTLCISAHCSLCAPGGVSQRICQSPCTDLTAPCALARSACASIDPSVRANNPAAVRRLAHNLIKGRQVSSHWVILASFNPPRSRPGGLAGSNGVAPLPRPAYNVGPPCQGIKGKALWLAEGQCRRCSGHCYRQGGGRCGSRCDHEC